MYVLSHIPCYLLFFLASIVFSTNLPQSSMTLTPADTITDSAAQLEVLPGNDVFVLINEPIPLGARITDTDGQPVPEVPVTFQIMSGPGVLAEMEGLTNAQGEATTSITVTAVLEPICIVVSIAALEPMSAVFTGVPEESLRLIEVSGNNQEASPGQILEAPFVVRMESQFESLEPACVEARGLPVAQNQPTLFLGQRGRQQRRVPVVGVRVTAEVVEGEADFVIEPGQPPIPDMVEVITNALGEAQFLLQIGEQQRDRVVVEVATTDIPQVEPVQFVTLIGFPFPLGIVEEADGSLAVIDPTLQAMLRVDQLTGQRTLISSREIGNGPPFGLLTGLVVEANGSFVVMSAAGSLMDAPAVVRVNSQTGDRTVVSGGSNNIGSGPPLLSPLSGALAADGSLVLIDSFNQNVLRIDLVTGARRIVSGGSVGRGPSFDRLVGIIVGDDGTLFGLDNGRRALIRIDPNSGNRDILSGDEVGPGPVFESPNALTMEANGALLVADNGLTTATEPGLKRVVRVDRDSGARTIVSGSGIAGNIIGSGPEFVVPTAIAALSDGSLIIGDSGLGAIMQVDPISGNRTIVSEARFGSGPPFLSPWRIAIEPDGSLIVIDDGLDAIIRVNPVTGERSIISDKAGAGSGPSFVNPIAIEVEANGILVVADEGADAVMRVDPHSGARSIVSGGRPDRGSGPPLLNPVSLAIAADGTFLTVDLGGEQPDGSTLPPVIFRITPQSGNRMVVSGGVEGRGSGQALRNPLGMALEADGTIVVVDCGSNCLFPLPPVLDPSIPATVMRIDPDTGTRTVVLGGASTFDLELFFLIPTDVAVQEDGMLLVTGGAIIVAAVTQVNPENGSRNLLSGMTVLGRTAGRGQSFGTPFGVAVTTDNTIMVADVTLGAIVAVDPVSGARTIVSK